MFSTTADLNSTAPIWIESGTATPVISFNGASVGVTYTCQIFRWTRIGSLCFFDGRVTLSSKGSSTGVLRIGAGALPYPSIDSNMSGHEVSIRLNNFSAGTGATDLVGDVIAGTSTPYLRVFLYISGTASGMTQASLTDTSDIIFNGMYRVA